jgi:hypothetical protein
MQKAIINLFLFATMLATAQVKKTAISSRINIGSPKARILPAAIKETKLHFKGFGLQILGDATDEAGNHMLIGIINIIEKAADKRDAFVNESIFGSEGSFDRNVIIATDKNYKVVKIATSYPLSVVKYNSSLKKFIVGCSERKSEDIDGKYTSSWLPTLHVVDIKLQGQTYSVPTGYSSYLTDLDVQGNQILLFSKSTEKNTETIKNEKLEIITVNLNQTHADKEKPWVQFFDPVGSVRTAYDDIGRLDLSGISKVDSTLYFVTSNLDQSKLLNKNHIYTLKNSKLEELKDFEFAYPIHKDIDWFIINSFSVKSENEYFFAGNKAAVRQMGLFRTNANFAIQKSLQIDTFDYTDWDKTVALPSGNIVMLTKGKDKYWHYLIYNRDLELVNELVSQVADSYYPQRLEIINESKVEAVFNDIDEAHSKDVIVQFVDVNGK